MVPPVEDACTLLRMWNNEGEKGGDGVQLWERVGDAELEEDVCVKVMRDETEEGKKVTRNGVTSLWEYGGGERILSGKERVNGAVVFLRCSSFYSSFAATTASN
jgi:hypothetical protein